MAIRRAYLIPSYVPPTPPTILTTSLPPATVGTPYSTSLVATGGTAPYTWSMTGSVPGLTLSSGGVLSGTPTTAGTDLLTFTATDSLGVPSAPVALSLSVNAVPGGAFIPQPGWTVSGNLAWDGQITVQSSSGALDPAGPIFIAYEDCRQGTPGGSMVGQTPTTAGPAVAWRASNSPHAAALYGAAGSGADGVHPAIVMLNNERAGNGNSFGRSVTMDMLAQYNQWYVSWAEHWNGWNGRNLEGGGGGYYKFTWFLNTDGNFGNTAIDMISPDFLERASTLFITGLTWSSGLATVTVNGILGGQTSGSGPTPGSTFTAQIGNSSGISTTPVQPAGWNGTFAGATVLNANQFTYPLATFPGNATNLGTTQNVSATCNDYGGYNTGVSAIAINNVQGGNSEGTNGVPGQTQFDGAGPATWDPNGWNHTSNWYMANQANPSTATGFRGGELWNAVAPGRVYYHPITSQVLVGTGNYASFRYFQLIGLLQCVGTHTVYRSNLLLQTGDATHSACVRFWVGNAPTRAACTHVQDCSDPKNWSASSAQTTLRQGALPANLGGLYLYVNDKNNNESLVGQFTQPFDFFISATGSDSNAGTLASPWALTALNTKRTTYAGKKVGVVGGTYSCLSLVGGSYTGTFDTPAFNIAGGTASAQTYIAPCDGNGNYSRGAAILDGGMNSTNNPNGQPLIGTIGNGAGGGVAGLGYITLDGFESKNCEERAVSIGASTGAPFSGTRLKGIVVQNNYVHTLTNHITGGNPTGITVYSCDGAIIQNNNVQSIGSFQSRGTGIEIWTSINTFTQNNTVISPNNQMTSGILHKNASQGNNTLRWNYIDMTLAGAGGQGMCCDDDTGATSTDQIYNNVIVADVPVPFDAIDVDAYPNWTRKEIWSNNTLVGIPGASVGMFLRPGAANTITYYNNINARTGTPPGERGDWDTQQVAPALVDYNCYPTSALWGFSTFSGGVLQPISPSYSTLAAWRTALSGVTGATGLEAHSKQAAPGFVGTVDGSGLPATKYKLATGSACIGAGSSNGTTSGTATDMGAWGGPNASQQVGSSIIGALG